MSSAPDDVDARFKAALEAECEALSKEDYSDALGAYPPPRDIRPPIRGTNAGSALSDERKKDIRRHLPRRSVQGVTRVRSYHRHVGGRAELDRQNRMPARHVQHGDHGCSRFYRQSRRERR